MKTRQIQKHKYGWIQTDINKKMSTFTIQKHLVRHSGIKATKPPPPLLRHLIFCSVVGVSLQLLESVTRKKPLWIIRFTTSAKTVSPSRTLTHKPPQKSPTDRWPPAFNLKGFGLLHRPWRAAASTPTASWKNKWRRHEERSAAGVWFFFPLHNRTLKSFLTQWVCFTNTAAQSHATHTLHCQSIRRAGAPSPRKKCKQAARPERINTARLRVATKTRNRFPLLPFFLCV